MSPARRLSLAISQVLFRFLLVILITMVAFFVTFGDASHIKRALVDTKAYNRFLPAVLDSNQKDEKNRQSVFADPNVRAITEQAFPPTKLQLETEKFIDSWYVWLSGATFQPEFVVDFSDSRQKLANDLGDYAINRLATLPQCPTLSAGASLDPLVATCQPIGVNLSEERANIQASLLTYNDFLPKVNYTASDLPKTNNGKTIPQAFAYAPFMFGMLWYAIWALAIIVILLGMSTVMLRTVRRNGWRQLGRSLLSTGIFLAVSGYIFGLVIPHYTRSFQSQFAGNGTESILNNVIEHLTVDFEAIFINFSIQVAFVGLLILLLLKILKPASRYEGLEKVTGLVNAMRPKLRYAKASRANSAPIISSERRNSTRYKRAKKQQKKSRASQEVA